METSSCLIVDCASPADRRGWCKLHYARWWRHGDPTVRSRRPSIMDRLKARLVASTSHQYGGTPCLEWTGSRLPKGYGKIGDRRGTKNTGWSLTHRVAYEAVHGPLSPDQFVCHHCDNPPCCNPDHLFLGDHIANVHDMWAKGRQRMPWAP